MEKAVDVRPRTRWGRRIGIAFAILILLLVVLYFVATSGAFLKGVILPRAGKSLNAEITVDDASISPFSQVVLKNFRLKTTGAEPLVSANEVRLRYRLMDIVKGHINVEEVTLDTPIVSIVKEADGSSNLDPLLKGQKSGKEEKKASDKKTDLNVRNVALKNGTVRITQKLKTGGPNTTELTGLNVALDQLKSGGSGKLTIASDLQMRNHPSANSNDVLAARINGAYDFAITPDLAPQSIKGSTKIQVTQVEGSFKEAGGLAANLDAEATPGNVNQLALRFEKSGQQLGQLRAHGPFDLAKKEGSLTVELLSLDKNILNIAGAASGMDFGDSTINSTNRIDVTRAATSVALEGRVTGKQLGVVRDQKPTPPVDLDFDYKLAADLNAKTAALDRLLLSARRQNTEFLTAKIDRPMNISWGGAAPEMKESSFRLVVTNLNLADWQAMLGTNPPSGTINASLVALAQNNGRKLALDINALVDQFGLNMGSNAIRNAQVAFNSKGTVEDFKSVDLPEFTLQIRSNNLPSLTAKGSAKYDVAQKSYTAQINADAALPKLLATIQSSSPLSSGAMTFNGNVKGTTNDTQINADITLTNLVVPSMAQSLPTNGLGLAMNLDANMRGQALELRQLDLKLSPTRRAENRLQIQGKLDLSTNNPAPGNLSIKSPGLDLTPYYDMFAATKTKAQQTAGATSNTTTATTGSPNSEPAAINLPVKQFISTVAIDKVFLREVAISNWVATMTISNNSVALNPLKLGVNGAPIAGDVALNLGVPGYAYDINVKVDRVPLEPFANSFATNQAGAYKGFLVADAKIRGAGTTGASLQKSLQGAASFSVTNLDLKIGNRSWWRGLLLPISLVLNVPELTETPVDFIDAQLQFGGGKISVGKTDLQSEAFFAHIAGDIPIEKILTNSPLNLPLELSLRRSLAEKAHLLPDNTPADAKYAALPKFVTIKGTLGNPKSDANRIAIAGLLARGVGGLVGGRTGDIVNKVGGLVSGTASSTNASGTNAGPAANLLQGFGSLINKNKSTNTTSTNSPAKNVLDNFFKPK
jgi:uncharacterized protein involved in outer membrane biogenesis